jgi:AcrR family transcriptional regulator
MGNREDLLDAATRCLLEKGYARTTARDIATAAGVSLAAIGYHYGTKDALLDVALHRALEAWGDDLRRALAAVDRGAGTSAQRFESAWDQVLRSFADNRPLWTVQFELLAHLDRNPELAKRFADASREARLGLVELFGDFGLAGDEAKLLMLGGFYQALLAGVASQWLVDPSGAPSGADLLDAVRAVAGSGC